VVQVAMWSFAHGGPPRRSGGFGAARRVEDAAVGVDEPAAPGSRGGAPAHFTARSAFPGPAEVVLGLRDETTLIGEILHDRVRQRAHGNRMSHAP
jgi:hypothetical protein